MFRDEVEVGFREFTARSGTLGANADASRVGLQNASPIRVGLGSLGSNYDKVRARIWGEIEAGFGKFCDLVENFGDLGRYTAGLGSLLQTQNFLVRFRIHLPKIHCS